MDINKVRSKITKYLESASSSPIIIDVADSSGLSSLESYFNIGSNEFLELSKFCSKDKMPQIDKLLNKLQKQKKNTFLLHLSSFLKLEGASVLKDTLRSMLDLDIEGKLVIITYQCSEYLKFSDPRIEAAGRIIKLDSSFDDITTKLPTLCFVSKEYSREYDAYVKGINNFACIAERNSYDIIYIETSKNKSDFPDSLYPIKQNFTAFDVISKSYPELDPIGDDAGSNEEWTWLLKELEHFNGWNDYVYKTFGGQNTLAAFIGNLKTMSDQQKWAYFIALKCYGAANNKYLAKVIEKSNSIEEFWDKLYSVILDFDSNSHAFKEVYDERKKLLSKVEISTNVIATFCRQVLSKSEKAINYLTDTSIQEKELAIRLIGEYADSYSESKLLTILSTTYPALYSYLAQYDYGFAEITAYFNTYKYCKVTNRILPEFMSLVDNYASNRVYYSLLNRRSSIVASKDKTKSKMYFVDALGIEFLNYIREACYSRQLSFDADIAYCELPSITCMNKEFCDDFKCRVDVKQLDELKHSGNGLYNYEQTKSPIHLIKELEIIDQVLDNVDKDLHEEGIERVFLVSDHGASRLAVLNEHENKWAVKEKGIHSGRCCPKSDIEEKPDFAAEDNGYWCLANYDRFQGGRKANVEVHGGATLEEVIVPIIEIKLAGDKPKCEICPDFKTIIISFKQKAKIQIFIAKQTVTAKVFCEGKYYDAIPSENKYVYNVDMPGVKRGHHKIDVYDGTTKIAEGLEFEAKNAGASENRYF